MPSDPVPFACLSFAVTKPGWGTSSLVVSLAPPDGYELRVKRIERGVSTEDGVRAFGRSEAASLDRWVRSLGFYDEGASSVRVPGAGSWSLTVAADGADDVVRGGTAYPESFPDLLATMQGLGLPGFERTGVEAFLADFCTVRAPQGGVSAPSLPIGANLPGSGMPELEQALAELARNPQGAEDALREQFRHLPDATKQELLAYIRRTDPEHYEWWRRLLG